MASAPKTDIQNELKELRRENAKLKKKLGELLVEADTSWKADHAVLGGKWHRLVVDPMRADMVLDSVKKGYINADATVLVIDRHE